MMDIFIISLSACIAALLTFFSGFGLGTVLAPIMMMFFPVHIAIALTGIVHLFNNLFKLILVGKYADLGVLIRFGIPAIICALLGSFLLLSLSEIQPLFSYQLFEQHLDVYPVKLIIAILLIFFALIDFIPIMKNLQFDVNKLIIGGALSGFFGGLSGVQGALRSAFLIKVGLTKESFIATAAIVSTGVDITRLSVYASTISKVGIIEHVWILLSAIVAGIIGSIIGNTLLKKVTMHTVQIFTATLLVLISIALGMGFL